MKAQQAFAGQDMAEQLLLKSCRQRGLRLYQRQTTGSVKEVAGRLEKAVKDNHGVLRTIDLRAKMAEKDGRITIAAVKPTLLIGMYEGGLSLQAVAEEIERTIIRMIDAVVV